MEVMMRRVMTLIVCTTVALLGTTGVASGQLVLPCCTDFDDNNLHSYGPGPPPNDNVDVTIGTPGPSGNPADLYMHVTDESGGSVVCGYECIGDWLNALSGGIPGECGMLCYDTRLIEDGCNQNMPECVANGGWIPITPKIYIYNGSLRAAFVANFTITDDVGPNPGWVHICAPVHAVGAGPLPSNADGQWQMLDGAPDSDWDVLISNVDEIRLPIDYTANPAEEAGYDNICFTEVPCGASSIPTLSEWAMIVFAVVILSLMTFVVIRRRRSTAQIPA